MTETERGPTSAVHSDRKYPVALSFNSETATQTRREFLNTTASGLGMAALGAM